MLSPEDVLQALRVCFDPVIPCNLVELGVVRSVEVTPDADAPGSGIAGVPVRHALSIVLAPASTEPEGAVDQTIAQVRNRFAGIEAVSQIRIALDERPWSPADITPVGRRQLGLDGSRNLVQIR